MVKILENREIDRVWWDKIITSSSCNDPYPYSWYLDLVCPGWIALTNENQTSGFPLPVSKKRGVRYVYTPNFLQKLGLYGSDENDTSELKTYISAIPEYYKFIDLSFHNSVEESEAGISQRSNFQLKLDSNYTAVKEGYTSDCRRNIRLSQEVGREISRDIKPGDAINLFRQGPGHNLKGVKSRDYTNLYRLMEYSVSKGIGEIWGVYSKGKLIYSLFFINFSGRITLLFTSTSNQSRSEKTGYLVIDSIISQFSGGQFTIDFAGSSIKSIESFVRSFGSELKMYSRLCINNLPGLLKFFKR